MDDPILREMVRFTLRYGRWIALVIVLAVGGAVAYAASEPRRYVQRAVYCTATTATEGPIVSFDLAISRVDARIARARAEGTLPPDVTVAVDGVMGQPPNLETTHLLEVTASGLDPTTLRKALELAGAELELGEKEISRIDRERILRHVTAVERELARVERMTPTPMRHELFVKQVKEISDFARFASPVRAYQGGYIATYEPRLDDRARTTLLPVALAITGGAAGGYLLAFLVAGVGAFLRARGASSRVDG